MILQFHDVHISSLAWRRHLSLFLFLSLLGSLKEKSFQNLLLDGSETKGWNQNQIFSNNFQHLFNNATEWQRKQREKKKKQKNRGEKQKETKMPSETEFITNTPWKKGRKSVEMSKTQGLPMKIEQGILRLYQLHQGTFHKNPFTEEREETEVLPWIQGCCWDWKYRIENLIVSGWETEGVGEFLEEMWGIGKGEEEERWRGEREERIGIYLLREGWDVWRWR